MCPTPFRNADIFLSFAAEKQVSCRKKGIFHNGNKPLWQSQQQRLQQKAKDKKEDCLRQTAQILQIKRYPAKAKTNIFFSLFYKSFS